MILENKLTRLFVAFPIPADITAEYSAYINRFKDISGLRWTKARNLHLTLFFIGEVEDRNIVHVINELKAFRNTLKSFPLVFEKITFRGKAHNPGMIWAQFEKCEAFSEVSSQLFSIVSKYMTIVPRHLDPIPHITLARLKKGSELNLIKTDEFPMPKEMLVDKMELWKTVHTPDGVLYEKLA